MGTYLNPGNEAFRQAVTDDIYVDKTGMIPLMNQKLCKSRVKYVCVSRPRRFGKTMAADMLAAYYSKGCDSKKLFAGREIEQEESYETHLNRHKVWLPSTTKLHPCLNIIMKILLPARY